MYPIDVLIGLRRTLLVGILLSGLLVATPSSVLEAQSVTLAWNPSTNTDIANYEVYYGPASQTYTNFVTVGNVTNATISGLVEGGTYYFAAKAVTSSGLQSQFSNEASYQVPIPTNPPAIQVAPGSLAYGTLLSGAAKTNSFTVSNTGGGTLSGTATVSAPYSIVSGGTYNLGAGQNQTVSVVFAPATAGTYNQNVTLSGGGGAAVSLTASATNAPPIILPAISAINVDATDVDLSTPGLQIYSGTTVQFSAITTNVQTWQWSYTVNGGSPVIYSSGAGAVTNVSYYFDVSTEGNSYEWTLVVSNGQAWAESQTNFEVETPPNGGTVTTNLIQGPTIAATSGTLNGLLTANTSIDGVPTTYLYQPLPSIGSTSGGTAVYNVTVTNAGDYEIQALVYAPSLNANSFLVNVDDQPQNPNMIWDIMPVTSGFEQRVISWRGNGSENDDQVVPKIFYLSTGPHQIIFVGREPGTAMASFALLQVVTSDQSQSSPTETNNPNISGSSTAQSMASSAAALASNQKQALTVVVNVSGILPFAVSSALSTSVPTNYNLVAGQTVTLNATVSGGFDSSASTYKWQFNSVDLPAVDTATLTLENMNTNQSGAYTVTVSNGGATAISSPATLTVYPTAAARLAGVPSSGKQFNLTVSGVPGYQYVVEASTNMVNWIPIQTNASPFLFIDLDAGKFKQRFYRSIYVP